MRRPISGPAYARTYAIATSSAAVSDDEDARYVPPIERGLAQYGFTAEPAAAARYRLVLSHETRPARVGIRYRDCAAAAPCGEAVLPRGFAWPGAGDYVHSLTLRFFDLADGREAYKVSATKRDRDADARRDVDALVQSALARLPFAAVGRRDDVNAASDWKVTLEETKRDGGPRVTTIAPLAH